MTDKPKGWYYLAEDSAEPVGPFPSEDRANAAAFGLAFAMDRGSVRTVDAQGFLHVAQTNISKSNVCPYKGSEIPNHAALGLDSNKVYHLLRDEEELRRAAATFNNVPLLSRHVPVDAEAPQTDLIIGSTGTDAAFDGPYLKNSLVVWNGDYIKAIEDEEQKELSSAYRYRADMTPGTYKGVKYDGVMRDIIGNHVALVKEGRAGADVVVGDSKPEEFIMTKTVLSRKALFASASIAAALAPKLAQDAKVDFAAPFVGVSAKNIESEKPNILKKLQAALKGKLAMDADLNGVAQLLDTFIQHEVAEGLDADPESGLPMEKEQMAKTYATAEDEDEDDNDNEEDGEKKRREFLAGKLNAEDMAAYDTEFGAPKPALDIDPATPPVVKGPEMQPDMVTKPAMDAALKAQRDQIVREQRETREAETAVEPYVGKLAMAHDSADGVYRTALGALGVDVADVKELPALKAILKSQPIPGTKKVVPVMATDSAAVKGFNERFPNAARINSI